MTAKELSKITEIIEKEIKEEFGVKLVVGV